MWFNIVLGNHGGVAGVVGLYPLVTYMRSLLSLCGHDVTVAYVPSTGPINLYFEHFQGPTWAEGFRDFRRNRGMKIGVLATELMVTVAGRTHIPYSKHGIAYSSPDEKNREHANQMRLEGFDAILSEVDFLWPIMQRTVDCCRSRTRICELLLFGSVGPLAVDTRKSPKDIDVLFVGKNTPHRTRVIRAMTEKGINVVTVGPGFQSGWQPPAIIESMLDRAKIGLNLTLHGLEDDNFGADPRFVSCQRVIDMLDRSTCVVSEDIPLDNPYADFIVSSPIEGLADHCRKMLADETWMQEGAARSAKFHDVMDVRKICRPVIDRTLAALG